MATTYTCDRCGAVLIRREDKFGGAHHIAFTDSIPWSPASTFDDAKLKDTDLCGECAAALKAWLETKVPHTKEQP